MVRCKRLQSRQQSLFPDDGSTMFPDVSLGLYFPPVFGSPTNSADEKIFLAYHAAHPWILQELLRLARRYKAEGRKRYGMKALFEELRLHRLSLGTEGEMFKLNNNYTSHYARLVMRVEPDLRGFFEVRG